MATGRGTPPDSATGGSARTAATGGSARTAATGGSARTAATGGSARTALLDRCLEFLRRDGFSQLSLREIASGAGTSHRMLIYHFGSREGLLAEVVGRVEAEQRAALAGLAAGDSDLAEIGRAFWRRVSDPALAPAERLFFEIYSNALYGRDWTASFRASVISAWQQPLVDLLVSHGFTAIDAAHRVRLGLAATRGLLLDLLITGDRAAVDAAYELLAPVFTAPPGICADHPDPS